MSSYRRAEGDGASCRCVRFISDARFICLQHSPQSNFTTSVVVNFVQRMQTSSLRCSQILRHDVNSSCSICWHSCGCQDMATLHHHRLHRKRVFTIHFSISCLQNCSTTLMLRFHGNSRCSPRMRAANRPPGRRTEARLVAKHLTRGLSHSSLSQLTSGVQVSPFAVMLRTLRLSALRLKLS